MLKGLSSPVDLWYENGGHSRGGRGLYAEGSVLEDQTGCGLYAEPFGSKEETIWRWLAVYVVFGADEGIKFVEDAERGE